MKRTQPEPRVSHFMGGGSRPWVSDSQMTWMESEDFCYPNGAMDRRARVFFPDGKRRVVRCGINDTWFSTPVRKSDVSKAFPDGGFLMVESDYYGDNGAAHVGELVFCPHNFKKE